MLRWVNNSGEEEKNFFRGRDESATWWWNRYNATEKSRMRKRHVRAFFFIWVQARLGWLMRGARLHSQMMTQLTFFGMFTKREEREESLLLAPKRLVTELANLASCIIWLNNGETMQSRKYSVNKSLNFWRGGAKSLLRLRQVHFVVLQSQWVAFDTMKRGC